MVPDASGKSTEPKSPRFKPRGGKEKVHTNQEEPQGNTVSISQQQMYTRDQPPTERYSPSRGRDRFNKKVRHHLYSLFGKHTDILPCFTSRLKFEEL